PGQQHLHRVSSVHFGLAARLHDLRVCAKGFRHARVRAGGNPRTSRRKPAYERAETRVRADQNPRTSRPKPAYEQTKTRVRADQRAGERGRQGWVAAMVTRSAAAERSRSPARHTARSG